MQVASSGGQICKLLLNLIQVTESMSGSVVPLAWFVCQLVKSSVSQSVSELVTRSPIELFWTAKNNCWLIYFRKCSFDPHCLLASCAVSQSQVENVIKCMRKMQGSSLVDVKCCGPHMCELCGPADLKVLSTTACSPMGPARRNVSLGARNRKHDPIRIRLLTSTRTL